VNSHKLIFTEWHVAQHARRKSLPILRRPRGVRPRSYALVCASESAALERQ
jgi:hypothetical protein